MTDPRRAWAAAAILGSLVLAGCNEDDGARADIETPGGKITVRCTNVINYQSHSAKLTGADIPLHITQIGVSTEIKVAGVEVDPVTVRQASDLIETLDNAQLMSCKGLLLVAPQDRYKVLQDYETQMITLTTLLRNLNTASRATDVQAAVATAGAIAKTATAAAATPPAPSAPATGEPPPAKATAATTAIADSAAKLAAAATTVASAITPPEQVIGSAAR